MDASADLLTQAFTNPTAAIDEASARLQHAEGVELVELLRVIGTACRELRRIDESVRHLRAAVDAAASLGLTDMEGRCSMSLAASMSYSGEFESSLAVCDHAVELLTGDDKIAAIGQLAGLLQRAGRNREALEAFSQALRLAANAEDEAIRGHLWVNRGVLYGLAGEIEAAEDDSLHALAFYEQRGWTKRAADVRHNLAWLAARRGNLIEAFRRFDDAERRYESLGLTGAAVFPDRCEALLAAGLTDEALALAERAALGLRAQGDDVDLAETLMLVARAALLGEDNVRAASASSEASDLFSAQERSGWWAAAASLNVDASVRAGTADDGDVERIHAVVDATNAAGLASACAEARLVAAELAAEREEWAVARTHLAGLVRGELGLAARCRADLVNARELAASGHDDDALAACSAAVDEFAELTAELGGTELRAHVALHVAQLVGAGLALAVRRADPVLAFEWSERQRAAALASPPVHPPDDEELAADLDRLRAALTQFDAEVRDGTRHGAPARCSRPTRSASRTGSAGGPGSAGAPARWSPDREAWTT